ncbi:MAG: hypothetical protein NVS2B9_21860 [Myxococcales bacterium]
MMLRRFAGIVALLAVFATPALAQSRLVCRYTGEAIVDCVQEGCPSPLALRDAGCCERRATAALPAANPAAGRPELAAPSLAAMPVLPSRGGAVARLLPPTAGTAQGAGPPIFIATRALLI